MKLFLTVFLLSISQCHTVMCATVAQSAWSLFSLGRPGPRLERPGSIAAGNARYQETEARATASAVGPVDIPLNMADTSLFCVRLFPEKGQMLKPGSLIKRACVTSRRCHKTPWPWRGRTLPTRLSTAGFGQEPGISFLPFRHPRVKQALSAWPGLEEVESLLTRQNANSISSHSWSVFHIRP